MKDHEKVALMAALKLLLVRVALWVMPARRHAVVTGFPDDEGNSVEMVRSLADRMPVYWLTVEEPASVQWLIAGAATRHPVHTLRKDSARAYLAYLTAKYVFFTHGLYGSPAPPPHKVFVNMWHGDGPKMSKRFAHIRSTYAVAGTQLWGQQRPVYFGVREDRVLVTGNPRIDEFARPPADGAMRRMGLDPDKPLVLWMPTYRLTEFRGRRLAAVRNWADTPELAQQRSVRALATQVAEVAQRRGIDLVIKPHPLDGDRYAGLGLRVLTSEDLREQQMTIYQLLGRTSGLVTDYSSVWTDYLAMDKPIGIYCPDLEQYQAERGLNVPDYLSLIPGAHLESVQDFERFLGDCLHESSESRQLRARSVATIGAETRLGASSRLLDAVTVPRPPAPEQRTERDLGSAVLASSSGSEEVQGGTATLPS